VIIHSEHLSNRDLYIVTFKEAVRGVADLNTPITVPKNDMDNIVCR
jgi:hypothetical protein